MKRVRPESLAKPSLIAISHPKSERSPTTLGIEDSCCLRCIDEPCVSFSDEEQGEGSTALVCPVDAIHHPRGEFGPAISEKCIGCGLCAIRCPVGALAISRERSVAVTSPDLARTRPALTSAEFFSARKAQEMLVDSAQSKWKVTAARLAEASVPHKQEVFYSLVGALFTAAGFPAWRPARGDTSNRVDLILIDTQDSLPIEIKSCAESPVINVKSVQQALENRVLMDQRYFAPASSSSSTLVVGCAYPASRSDVFELIEDISYAFHINVGLISLADLYFMVIDKNLGGKALQRSALSQLRGTFA